MKNTKLELTVRINNYRHVPRLARANRNRQWSQREILCNSHLSSCHSSHCRVEKRVRKHRVVSSPNTGKHDVVTPPINSAWARTYVAHVGTGPQALRLAPPARHPVVFFLARFDFAEPLSASDTCQLGARLANGFTSTRVKKRKEERPKKPFLVKGVRWHPGTVFSL